MSTHASLMAEDKKKNLKRDLLAALAKNGYDSDNIDQVMNIITEPQQPFEIVHYFDQKEDIHSKMNLERE